MRRTILILTIATMLSGFVFGQSKAEQEIRQTLDAIAQALNKNDLTVLSDHYHDSYTFTNAQGETTRKATRLELIKNTRRESFSYGDVNIRVFGDTAVVIGNPTFTAIDANGQKTNVKDRNTMTMLKNGGRWQIVAVHISNNLHHQAGGGGEPAVRQTITELMNALNRNDLETVGRIYADDYQITLQDGTTATKAERLNQMKSGGLRYVGLVFDNLKIRQYGNAAAVATYRVTGKSVTPKGEQNTDSQATVTLVKNGGGWRVVSSQLTESAAK
jgi:uncharacterized protein (TIGR02246 family)